MSKRNRSSKSVRFYYSKRFLIAFLIFLGYVCLSLCRMNFNIAIVDMVSNNTNSNQTYDSISDKFYWNSKEMGFVLGLIFYGSVFSPLGGFLASRFDGVKLFGVGVAVSGILTVLTPFLLRLNFILFCVSRFILGIFQVFSIRSVPEIWSRWSPPNERAKLTSLSHTGVYVGILVTYPLGGILAKTYSWPVIFYVTGILPLIWCIIWFIFVSNDPAEDKYIPETERLYLTKTINRKINDKVDYSWEKIFSSKAVWAYFIGKFAYEYGQAISNVSLPLYVKDATHVDIKKVGLISAIPQFCSVTGVVVAGYILDYVRSWKNISPTKIHKFYVSGGCTVSAIFLCIIPMLNFIESMFCISLQRLFLCFVGVSFNVIILDMAPRYASILGGIGGFFSFVANSSSPTLIGFIVTNHELSEWSVIFIIYSVIYLIGAAIFLIYGSGKLQFWSLSVEEKQKMTEFKTEISS